MASEIKVDTISEKTSANGVSIDSVKYDYIKNNDDYDAVTEGNVRYYQSNKVS